MPTTKRKPAKKTPTKPKPKTKTKKTGSRKPKVAKKTKKTTKKTRTVTREVIREVPVFFTTQRVPFLPFNAMDTDAARNNMLGYMRGLLDGRNAPGVPRVNPLLTPTNTRRSQRKPASTRIQGDRAMAQGLLNDHYGRHSRHNDARTSVFEDIERGMGLRPQRFAI